MYTSTMNTSYIQIRETGCQLIAPITIFGNLGPKHHGIVIGKGNLDNHIYIAENTPDGYALICSEDFIDRYKKYGEFRLQPNNGPYTSVEVANRALRKVFGQHTDQYCLFTNNCESFASEMVCGKRTSQQVRDGVLGCILIAGAYLALARRAA